MMDFVLNMMVHQVPTRHGKADLEIYRAAGAEVVTILMGGGTTERASVGLLFILRFLFAGDLLSNKG